MMGRIISGVSVTVRVATILTVMGVVAGCGLTPTHTPRAADEWSNGKLMGTAILNNRVALQVDDVGHAFLVWVGPERAIVFAHLDERAETVVQTTLALDANLAQQPQLALDSDGQLHLIWIDRWDRETQVFYTRLSADGGVIQDPVALAPPDRRATHATMVVDPIGRTVEVFWSGSSSSRPGCYHTALDWQGNVVSPAAALIPEGLFPVAQVDHLGYIHLAWRVDAETTPEFRYAVYDPERRTLGPDIVASRPSAQMGVLGGPTAGARFDGPELGLDERSAYLAWVLQMRERERRDVTFYLAFPVPELPPRASTDLFSYAPPDVAGQAVRVEGAAATMTGHPRFLEGQPARQILTCFTQVSGPGNLETLQIVAADLLPKEVEGQEIVNRSRGASLRPIAAMDAGGHRHVAWIDTAGFERYNVVYASTSPLAKETLNVVTTYDVVNKALDGLMSVITSLFFIPLALIWVAAPVAWLVIFTLANNVVDVRDRYGYLSLAVAMLLQLVIKVALFGDLLSRFPSTSLVAPALNLLIGRWLFPVLLAAVSGGLVWVWLRRSEGRSVFAAYFMYAAIDSFLTLFVYVALPIGQMTAVLLRPDLC